MNITAAADRLARDLPCHRVEILQGRLTATPHDDGTHALVLTRLAEAFHDAGARAAGLSHLQALGLWLPSGPDDFAVPDFSVVERTFMNSEPRKHCYAPEAFRMVLEVTGDHWPDDLHVKAHCYAQAGIPVYVVADRHHDEAVLHTDPQGGEYRSREAHKRGTTVTVPESVGVTLELPVDLLLDGE
ncbi:Uma2 family endonuclease [Streptomyces sp. Ag109_G2-6]|uniref:Uma2 family endonuclease n=1 Tax=Streptomyces TaxID=1883 RepID=UPI0009A48086|nr:MULTISPECIES: Uma2 family endonuclease [Streptomyces]RPF41176.1 Uma2 family endonuclease [Streptomyces sp. Ag109_G2-6]